MSNTQAIEIVLRAAKAHANGSEDAAKILRAVERVREMLKLTPFCAEPRKAQHTDVCRADGPAPCEVNL